MRLTTGLEKLLRGEAAAVESYERAIRDMDGDGATMERLREMLQDHRDALSVLRRHAPEMDVDPDQGAGPWGTFAKAVEKAGAALGGRALLEAMQQGETHGLSEYRTVLASDDVPAGLEKDIRERLLPAQERHVTALDELMRGRPGS